MSGGHAVWRPFKVNGSFTRCTVCRQRFSDKERVQANPPTAEQPGWKNIRCHPGCAQAAKSRVPSKGKVPPRPIIFGNEFATTRCCLCNNRIAVGAKMKATKIGHMWHEKKHHPSCTPAPCSRRSGTSASDSGLGGGGGGGHVSSPPRGEDPARKRPRSVIEERERPQKQRRGGAAAADARPGSGAQSGSRSRPAPRRGPTAGTAGSEEVEVECIRALTSTQRIDERISQRQRELGVVDVEDDDDDSAASCRNLAVTGQSGGNSSRSTLLPVVKVKRSKADHAAAASCRNLAVTEGWVVDLSSVRSRPLPMARAEPSRMG
ncbi:unnamed protein product [Ectocarpus sp. 4 AP-2014]